MKNGSKKGIVYIVKNPSFKGDIIKIGITRNLKQRLSALSGSNVPYPFECLHACEVKDCKEVESAIYKLCINSLVSKEFYNTDPEPIIRLLKQLSIREITNDVDNAIKKKVDNKKIKARIVLRKNAIPDGYKTYNELKKHLIAKPNFRAGYFTIRVISNHKWKKIPYYQFKDEFYYKQEIFLEQAKNEGILTKQNK